MDITESKIYKEHRPRFSVQVVAAGLILTAGYVVFSLWEFGMSQLLGVMVMFIGGVNMAAVLYTKFKTGKDVLEQLAKRKEAKP
jgi:ABC-type enterochelin transport system permease subunit